MDPINPKKKCDTDTTKKYDTANKRKYHNILKKKYHILIEKEVWSYTSCWEVNSFMNYELLI